MTELAGKTLVRKNKTEVSAAEALKDKELILYYFSAHWCPPCRMFTPVLADFYNDALDDGESLEIVFVSSDQSEDDLYLYMNEAHGDWLAVKYGESIIKELSQKYGVSGIPALVVLRKDGSVVTKDGRQAVQNKGTMAIKEWLK